MSKRAEGGTGKLVNRAYWLGFVAGFGFKTIFDSFMVRTLAERYKRALDRFTEKEIWRQANKVTHSHGQHGPHTHDDYVNHQQPIDTSNRTW